MSSPDYTGSSADTSRLGLSAVSNRWDPAVEVPYEWDAACAPIPGWKWHHELNRSPERV